MTLIERNPVSHLLTGMVKCRHCDTPMVTAGESFTEAPRYVCATRNEGCNTPEIEAGPFTGLVVRRAVHAFLSLQNISEVSGIILNEAKKEERKDLRAALGLEQEEQPSPEQDQPPKALLAGYPGQFPEELTDNPVADGRDSVVIPLTVSRKVEDYGLNPETYLRPSNLRTTKAIMEILISEILVGSTSATIQYSLPVNPGGWPEYGTAEEVPIR